MIEFSSLSNGQRDCIYAWDISNIFIASSLLLSIFYMSTQILKCTTVARESWYEYKISIIMVVYIMGFCVKNALKWWWAKVQKCTQNSTMTWKEKVQKKNSYDEWNYNDYYRRIQCVFFCLILFNWLPPFATKFKKPFHTDRWKTKRRKKMKMGNEPTLYLNKGTWLPRIMMQRKVSENWSE